MDKTLYDLRELYGLRFRLYGTRGEGASAVGFRVCRCVHPCAHVLRLDAKLVTPIFRLLVKSAARDALLLVRMPAGGFMVCPSSHPLKQWGASRSVAWRFRASQL